MAHPATPIVDLLHRLVDWAELRKKRCARCPAGRVRAHSGVAVSAYMFNETQGYLTKYGVLRIGIMLGRWVNQAIARWAGDCGLFKST